MKTFEPKKSLGQHFLRSEKALNTIADAMTTDPPGSVYFEIGPGEGVLTEKLLAKNLQVVAVEIDKRSIEFLQERFVEEIKSGKLKIVDQDCLEIDYSSLTPRGKGYSIVGNIPYYITGAIFRTCFEQKVLPQQVVFLIQKEVAQRIVASDKKESLLSVSIKIFSPQVKILEIVKKGSFVPPPKVDSAIIAINNIVSPFKNQNCYEIFFKILKAGFSHKRKFFFANLKTDLDKDLYEKYLETIKNILLKNYSEKIRAEDISIQAWH
jgi:16S rRNA (adenine1518-N6/adenine1519-N6)-dimethyltransferase